jgi:hypothetical protein
VAVVVAIKKIQLMVVELERAVLAAAVLVLLVQQRQ